MADKGGEILLQVPVPWPRLIHRYEQTTFAVVEGLGQLQAFASRRGAGVEHDFARLDVQQQWGDARARVLGVDLAGLQQRFHFLPVAPGVLIKTLPSRFLQGRGDNGFAEALALADVNTCGLLVPLEQGCCGVGPEEAQPPLDQPERVAVPE